MKVLLIHFSSMTDTFFQLSTFVAENKSFAGLVLDSHVINLAEAAKRAGKTIPAHTAISDLLCDWDRAFDALAAVAEHAASIGPAASGAMTLAAVNPRPPLGRMGKLLYAAANYSDHVAGMRKTFTPPLPHDAGDKSLPSLRPYMFGKMNVPTGAYDDIILPEDIERIDWEAELMVAIGRPGRNVKASKASEHIAGYMTTNDVSCRDLTWREDRPNIRSDWLAGKSFDSFAPIGPCFTPKAFIPDHANLWIRLWVNGQIKQDGNSGDMIFSIEEQIEYASHMMTLLPGDVIATGTPAGTGQERLEFLKPGDIVETEVQYCGRQRNHVVAAQ